MDLSKYKSLFFDVDDTLLDFKKAEKKAMTISLKKVGINVNDSVLATYHKINMKYWKMLEQGKIHRDDVLILRHKEFLPLYGCDFDPVEFEKLYRKNLDKQAFVIYNSRKVLAELSKNFKIYAVTNGAKNTQIQRCKKAKIDKYFIKSYISYEIGISKPDVKFFEYIENDLKDFDKKTSLIIGDRLSSDIKLGNDYGIDTCWYNKDKKENNSDIKPTYVINNILDLIR